MVIEMYAAGEGRIITALSLVVLVVLVVELDKLSRKRSAKHA